MNRFNVRVYGILIQDSKVLVSDEYIKGNHITKFPGGGLEFGEGTIDCVKREFMEELNLPIEVESHFYTTDFFVASAFAPNNQVISIYYKVKPVKPIKELFSSKVHDYKKEEGAQSFRWILLNKLSSDDLTLIIDKRVVEMLLD
ncbi:MAG: NUDIX domain-containing protein [Bacteroidia bacterium]|jgi:8-oxo-dGTP diphosphatase|nr:NUDIX domain-containing protein [Bacteroidia bacterium]